MLFFEWITQSLWPRVLEAQSQLPQISSPPIHLQLKSPMQTIHWYFTGTLWTLESTPIPDKLVIEADDDSWENIYRELEPHLNVIQWPELLSKITELQSKINQGIQEVHALKEELTLGLNVKETAHGDINLWIHSTQRDPNQTEPDVTIGVYAEDVISIIEKELKPAQLLARMEMSTTPKGQAWLQKAMKLLLR